MSSNTKKKKIWGAITCHEGKGTCHVDMLKVSAMGWKSQIYIESKLSMIVQSIVGNGSGAQVKYVQIQDEYTHTAGNSIVKCEKRTCLVQSHCSFAVGILLGWSFHFLK